MLETCWCSDFFSSPHGLPEICIFSSFPFNSIGQSILRSNPEELSLMKQVTQHFGRGNFDLLKLNLIYGYKYFRSFI